MKIAINACYGGWELSKDFLKKYPQFKEECGRDDVEFINCLEEFGLKEASGKYSKIVIAEISNEATDFIIEEYDGYETIIYVVNGVIFRY